MKNHLASIENHLLPWGIKFQDLSHLEHATCHPSYQQSKFEQYEFLGDRVIGLIVTNWLISRGTRSSEGELSREYATWVNKNTLADMAVAINLTSIMKVKGNIKHTTLMADGFEALVGAIYLDQGMAAAEEFLHKIIRSTVPSSTSLKTLLQEWAHKQGTVPVYTSQRIGGSDHNPLFQTTLRVNELTSSGQGSSKKDSENMAVENFVKQHKINIE